MRNWASSLFALFLLAAPVAATPPRVITVEDQLFARNTDTLIILRTVRDNHGLYTVMQTDTLVVFRNLRGGDDRGFQVASRVVDRGIDAPIRAEVLPLPAPINPFEVFADFGAWPLRATGQTVPGDLRFDDTGLTFSGFGNDRRFHLPLPQIKLRIGDTLAATRAVAPPTTLGGGSTGLDRFDPAAFDLMTDCSITAVRVLYDYDNDPALARIACADQDFTQEVQLWLVVPQSSD